MVVPAGKLIASLQDALLAANSYRDILTVTAETLGDVLSAERVLVLPANGELKKQAPVEWSESETDPANDRAFLSLAQSLERRLVKLDKPLSIDNLKSLKISELPRGALAKLNLQRALAVNCASESSRWCTLQLYRNSESDAWKQHEIKAFEQAAKLVAERIERFKIEAAQPAPVTSVKAKREQPDYRRLVENSDAIQFITDERNVIRFVSRRALDFFGVLPEDFVGSIAVEWFDLIHLDDRERVIERATQLQATGVNFEEEFRVINHITGRERWLLIKFVPVRDQSQQVTGWDAFGIDITARREAQEALDVQSRKVRALYTVSTAIRGYLDPSNIAARGLTALCEATGAEAGLCYLFTSTRSKELNLVAHHGFSASFDAARRGDSSRTDLFRSVAEKGQAVVVSDILSDPRAKNLFAEDEGFRSLVIVPVAAEEEVFGTLALFHTDPAVFDGGDVMLVGAAANQIGLAARQANLFSAFRKQTKNMSALYRMSHELSNLLTLEEIFQQAFTIIRDELGLKRLWLGLLNEQKTWIIGQAAYGPGWKRRLVEMNVELSGEENPLREVVATKKALVVHNPDAVLGQLGLRRFFSRFAIKSLGLAPLLARGQVLGVLAVQPGSGEPAMEEEEITLLSSLANEIAALIFTKRLEERIAEGEKMRSAGLLAAGIAHNFNNLLQAVLGQASLLEMQRKNEDQVLRAARIISESATKGASLVKQLLSFANLEEAHAVPSNVNRLIEAESKNWTALLRPNQLVKYSFKQNLPRAMMDERHFLRIISSLLTNASEAMQEKGGPIQIFTDSVSTDQDWAHFEVPAGRYVRVGVRDSGIGMDAETKRRCFEPFFTTKNVDPASGLSLSGAGLGLAAAYALARKNGGRLVVDSRLGHGSVFTLYLPIERTAEKRDEQDQSQAKESSALLLESQRKEANDK